jgi:hypothetical protein
MRMTPTSEITLNTRCCIFTETVQVPTGRIYSSCTCWLGNIKFPSQKPHIYKHCRFSCSVNDKIRIKKHLQRPTTLHQMTTYSCILLNGFSTGKGESNTTSIDHFDKMHSFVLQQSQNIRKIFFSVKYQD